MSEYVLPHSLPGEEERLALMSSLLDPLHRRQLQARGVGPGWRCLEVGSGNGSVGAWLAGQVGPSGRVVATDIDTSYLDRLAGPNLVVRRLDILRDAIEPAAYDLVTARAVLHHLVDPERAIRQMIAMLAPGGWLLLIEPDFLPVAVAEPAALRAFWQGWLGWAKAAGIDYHIGRTLAPRLAGLGLEAVAAAGETALFNGGSPWATYWEDSIAELRESLLRSGNVTEAQLGVFAARFTDPGEWSMVATFVATWGRKPAAAGAGERGR